jgi:hypothetical protein
MAQQADQSKSSGGGRASEWMPSSDAQGWTLESLFISNSEFDPQSPAADRKQSR